MNVLERIRDTLRRELAPERLDVVDESGRHSGHAGARPGEITHVRLSITAELFRGKSRVERHRMVNQLLAPELARGLHALAIEAKAPDE